MIKVLVFASLLLVGALAITYPRVARIEDIDAADLFMPPNDITNVIAFDDAGAVPVAPNRGPLPANRQTPQSHRIVYKCFTGPNQIQTGATLTVNLVAVPAAAPTSYNVKYESPYLEIDPWGCAGPAALTGDCRCNNPAAEVISGNFFTAAPAAGARFMSFNVPTATYFEHAPYPGQSPYMRTYRKVCIKEATSGIWRDTTVWLAVVHCCSNNAGCTTAPGVSSLLAARPSPVTAQAVGSVWAGGGIGTDLASYTGALSYSYTINALPPGVTSPPFIGLAGANSFLPMPDINMDPNWKCNREGYLGAFFDFSGAAVATLPGVATRSLSSAGEDCWGETAEMTVARQQRSVCCGASAAAGYARLGTCINPSTESCCGWKPFSPKYEQCCSKRTSGIQNANVLSVGVRINYIDQPCKCSIGVLANNLGLNNEFYDCQINGPNLATDAGGVTAATTAAPNANANYNRRCCTMTKYPEFNNLTTTTAGTVVPALEKFGVCYDTTSANIRCCDDGNIFDIGSQQCCPINGVQSLNTPCPCNIDSHCAASGVYHSTDAQPSTNMMCCMQQFPRTWEDGQGPNALSNAVNAPNFPAIMEPNITGRPPAETAATVDQIWPPQATAGFYPTLNGPFSHCDKYSNWPIGQAPAEVQRCQGSCIDKRFQTCCNGQICVRNYERCCNSTCCNRFTSGCMEGTRPGTIGFGGRTNPNNFGIYFESCSSIEVFTTRRAFWVWVMPTFWTLATVISLAVVVVISRRATENIFPLTERLMVFFAVVIIGLSVPHYFAPTYKYGIVIVFTSMFAIVGAVAQSKKMSFVTVLLVVVMLLLWFDPFEGNIYVSLTGGFSPANVQGQVMYTRTGPNYFSGILEALFNYERVRAECVGFYDYFLNDPAIHDTERMWNPNKNTFGFCTRAWMTTLLIFSLMTLAFLLILLVLSVFSLAKKLLPKSLKEDMAYELPLDAAPVY